MRLTFVAHKVRITVLAVVAVVVGLLSTNASVAFASGGGQYQ